jgi:hypothetical protein
VTVHVRELLGLHTYDFLPPALAAALAVRWHCDDGVVTRLFDTCKGPWHALGWWLMIHVAWGGALAFLAALQVRACRVGTARGLWCSTKKHQHICVTRGYNDGGHQYECIHHADRAQAATACGLLVVLFQYSSQPSQAVLRGTPTPCNLHSPFILPTAG